ncbi:MAG: polynucleotide adenylyltransferase PcnB [Vicinamibacterales bacterium]|nr:polynucleotide adenylyltransferase PcnB [Vicinamibacterales bacterium]
MSEPVVVPRADHPISRGMIDPDALKVLYRLNQFNYTAYLVGGSVRDMLLGRAPKDFDIGTSAHPYQIKKLFRNCWIIGRRFRLAHVRFGTKTIEVATFRKHVLPGTENEGALDAEGEAAQAAADPADLLIKRDNTFGTPEEDALRRDFTINALIYDIATFSIIDYVGGLQDIRDRIVRSIGDPNERFQEDPVRMWRAVAIAARLDFTIEKPIIDAIKRHRGLIAMAAPARLIEEYYKILRSGYAERTFQGLADHGLLEPVTPDLQRAAKDEAWRDALDALDSYRQRFETAPPTLTNAILLGTMLVPIGLMPARQPHHLQDDLPAVDRWAADAAAAEAEASAADEAAAGEALEDVARQSGRWRGRRKPPKEPQLMVGLLPIARRDVDRLRQVLALQRRLLDLDSPARVKRTLVQRGPFTEALTWLEIHGHEPEVLEHWRGFIEALGASGDLAPAEGEGAGDVPRSRRRRGGRRRRGR